MIFFGYSNIKLYTPFIVLVVSSIVFLAGCVNDSSDNPSSLQEAGSGTYQLPLPGYILPSSKQGISDRNYDLLIEARYQTFENNLNIGIQKYNYYWQDAEDLSISASQPQHCGEGYMLFPADEDQKKSLGIHRYHCYKKSFLSNWEKRFQQNANHHIQIAVVLWTAPEAYRDPGCEGFYFSLQKRHLKEGCYPVPSHYDDYEDWIRLTAHRFGKYIDHYIVWNEAGSTNWADSSTTEYPKEAMAQDLDFHMKRSFDIYSSLLQKTIAAVDSLDKSCLDYGGACKNMVYVSLDRGWYLQNPTVERNNDGAIKIRWQNINLLDHIWNTLGLAYDWAVAIHPYGEVYGQSSNSLRFATLRDLSSYQEEHIVARKVQDRSGLSYPQSRLFASEQNVNNPNSLTAKARFICESYDVAIRMPELIAITHNHFQDSIHQQDKTPTYHAMLPPTVNGDLSNAGSYETFQAYLSTTVAVWNKRDDHFCCTIHNVGCKVP